jgi:hypothetical protein
MYERAIPAKLFGSTVLADPSFNRSVAFDLRTVALTDTAFSILDNDADYTIALISRCWAHSSGAADTFLNTSSLSSIVDNLGGVISNQPAQHAASPPSAFIRIMQGTMTIPRFISAVASHLDRYTDISGVVEISLLMNMWQIAMRGTHPFYSSLLAANRDSVPLWTSIFSLLRKTASDKSQHLHGGWEADFLGIILPLTRHISNTIGHCNDKCSRKEHADLIERWVTTDFFLMLDVVIPFCARKALHCSSMINLHYTVITDIWHC